MGRILHSRMAALPIWVRNSPSINQRATHPRGARGWVVVSLARISTRAQAGTRRNRHVRAKSRKLRSFV